MSRIPSAKWIRGYVFNATFLCAVASTSAISYASRTATPTFSPTAGTYSSSQTVTISDSTTGATIYYTTNGSTPTTSSTQYTGPITVSSTQTVKAIATASGYTQSYVGSATYTIASPAATPTFSPAAGTYSSAQSVTISDSTPGAIIYYSTDGGPPTTSSKVYSGQILLNSTQTLNAIATASGYGMSAVGVGAYTIGGATAPSYVQQCNIYDSYNTSVSCTLNGVGAGHALLIGIYGPTTLTSVTSSAGIPASVIANQTFGSGSDLNAYILSNTASGNITISANVGSSQSIWLSVTEYANVAVSPVDGSAGGASTAYTSTVSTSNFTTTTASDMLWSLCTAPDGYPLTVGTAPITWNQVAIPTGSYPPTALVQDGVTGQPGSYYAQCATGAPYTNIVTVAIKGAGAATAATPTFSPAAGPYSTPQTVTISDSTSGSTIYYTTDGSTPTTSSTQYTNPIAVNSTETVKAIATAPGYSQSAVGTAEFTISPPAATPTFSPAAGTYGSPQTVTISDSTSGATIYYTTNGSTPTTSSTQYSGPVTVSSTGTLKAIATALGYSQSAVGSATYTITSAAATPTFSPAAGTYSSAQTVTISDSIGGAVIYYTTDGSTPSTSSAQYTGPITVNSTTTLKAIATASGFTTSAVGSATYTIGGATAPSYVQQCNIYDSYNTSVSCTLNGVGAGHALLIGIYGPTTLTSVTSSAGTPTSVIADQTFGSGSDLNAYILSNTASGNITISANVSSSQSIWLSVTEYANVAVSPVDGSASGASTAYTSAVSTSNFTTTTASDMLWSLCTAPNGSPLAVGSAPIVWNQVAIPTGDYPPTALVENGVAGAAGTYYGQCTVADSYTNIVTVAIKGVSAPDAATPTFSPASGSYSTPQTVTISDSTPGATIYYTTDGSTPTTSSTQYTGPITASSSETVKAIATAPDYAQSGVGVAAYTITPPTRITPTITWATPSAITYGTALDSNQLNASAGEVTGTFAYSPSAGSIPTAGQWTLSVVFTPTDTVDYNTATAIVTLTVNKATPSIIWPTPTPITYGTALSSTQLNAGTTPAGTFVYSPAAGTVLAAGVQTLSTTFIPTDSLNYNSATASISLTVNKATPVITWPTPTSITYGIPLSTTQLNASTATAGTFAYTPEPGTVLSAGLKTLSTIFTPTDASDYNSATASVNLLVDMATPVITWNSPAPITYGTLLSSTQLNASADVAGTFAYTPPLGTVLAAGTQTLSTAFTPSDSSDYSSTSASRTLTVNQATPIVSWTTPAPISYGTPLSSTQLNAVASVPGTFAYTPPAGTILPAGRQSLTVTFSPTDSADYTTATQSVSIVVGQESFTMPGPGQITTMAGNGTQGYLGDGAAALEAELSNPSSIAVDSNGNAYIADARNNVVREVLASSNEIHTVAGSGTAGYSGDGGTATGAQLNAPTSVALDSAGNLYIADTNNNAIRIVNLANGMIHTIAGNGISGYSGDGGNPVNAQLNNPTGVAVDSTGTLYIADSANNVIRKIGLSGSVISTVAGNAVIGNSGDGGPATDAELNFPTSVAVDGKGDVYIADTLNDRIRKLTVSTGIISAYAGQGSFGFAGDGGPALSATFGAPTGLATDANGNLYITDVGNSVVRKVAASTQFINTIAGNNSWGYSGDGGPAISAQLGIDQVDAVAVDSSGNIYIADTDNNVVRVVGGVKATPTVTVSASPSEAPFGAVSSTLSATISSGTGSVSFSNGAGWNSGPVLIVNGIASTVLNNAGWDAGIYTISATYSGDSLDSTANGSAMLAVTSTGKATPIITWAAPASIQTGTPLSSVQLNATASVPGTFIYSPAAGTALLQGANTLSVLFLPNDTALYNAATASVALTVNPKSWGLPDIGIINTIVGNGILGYAGDGGIATGAELTMFQSGIAVDAAGDIYIADWQNNVVRKLSAETGNITTIAGSGIQGYSGDGGAATSAELNGPAGVAVDAIGNVYIADTGNNVIREVSPGTQIITTIVGNGTLGYSGDNGPASQAELYFPFGITVSARGDIYIAEMGNNVVRKVVSETGMITTVAGTGTAGYTGDNAPATSATLSGPSGIAIDNSGNLYIADFGNNSIRAVFTSGNIPGLLSPVNGNIYTLVGNGSTAVINATLNNPESVAVDPAGNIYIADAGNNQIREVYSSGFVPNISNAIPGTLYTLAGTGTAGYTGDGGPATSAMLSNPGGVAIDGSGHIYIADTNNQVVRAIGTPAKLIPTISWTTLAPITYGTSLSASQLDATASVPGDVTYEPPAGVVLKAGTHQLGVTFTPSDTTTYATVTSTSSLTVNKATPVITWATPTSITPGTALGAAQLNATASVPGSFVYSPGAGTIAALGPLTISVTFTPTDSVDYTPATSSVTMMVQQVTPTINWPTPAAITFGTPLSTVQLYATASVPGTFTFSHAVGTVLPAGTTTLIATFTPNDTIAYTTATATVSLVVNQAAPTITWATPDAITFGTPLSPVQLNARANIPGTFTYNPEAGVVPSVGTTTLTATFAPSDSSNYTTATAQVVLAVNQTLPPGTPILQLRMSPTPNTVVLSNPQHLDWIVWGSNGTTTAATRMAGASLISDMMPIGGASIIADLNGQVGYSWTGGTPTSSGNAVTSETNTGGTGAGFQITAPADTTVRTLLLYVKIGANAQLTASLSDGSSSNIIHAPSTPGDTGNEIYAIDYRAASSGQTLTVQLVSTDSSATVGLQAAVLQPHLPDVAILSPVAGQSYPLTGVPIITNATQFDSSIASVQLIVNGANSTLLTSAPFETILGLPAGHYSLTAQASDAAGLTNTSAPVEFDIIRSGGTLVESYSLVDSDTVNLTAEGTADWTIFTSSTNFGTQVTRKAGVVPEISDFTVIGSGTYSAGSSVYSGPWAPFSFDDGTPDERESHIWPTTYLNGSGSYGTGFQITAPADTNPRTLRLYVSPCGSDVQMNAFLSDGSAPTVTDNSLHANDPSPDVYSFSYAAATAGQALTVRLTMQGADQGSVCLVAASLAGPEVLANVESITPQSGVAGATVTVAGTGFGTNQGTSTVTISGMPLSVLSWSNGSIRAALPAGIRSGPVQVTTAVGASNSNVVFTLAPTVTNLSPAVGPIGTIVTIAGTDLGTSQGDGTVTFNGVLATPTSWSDTQIIVPVPAGATTGRVAVTQSVPASASPLFAVSSGTPGAPTPVLHVRLDDSPKTVNLADPVNQDWVVWGSDGSTVGAVRKAGANLIGNLASTSGAQPEAWYGSVQYSWTGGSPTQSGDRLYGGISSGTGFQFTVPADTTARTLRVYCGYIGWGQLNVSISDGSSPAVSFAPPAVGDLGERVYSIDYRAASPGQILTVQLVPSASNRYPALEAAILQPHLPYVSVNSPLDNTELAAESTIPLGVDSWQFDSSINSVSVFANGNPLFTLPPTSSTATWTPQPGHYSIQAQAVDSAGLSNQSRSISVDIIGTGGTLSQTNGPIPSNVDLTALGTADWVLFEYCGKLPYFSSIRKAGVTPLISELKTIGDEWTIWGDSTDSSFSFEDGTPVGQDSTQPCGVTLDNGVAGNGFELNVKADTNPRTLYLFVANREARGKLKAFLSDGSAPVLVDTSVVSQLDDPNLYGKAQYAIHFRAASPGQTLTVQWTTDALIQIPGWYQEAYTEVYAAALEGPPLSVSAGPTIQSLTPDKGAVGTLVTIRGSGFGVSQGTSTVTFNGNLATPSNWSDTQVQVPAPLADNTGNVIVTVGGVASDPVIFNMPPTITSLSSTAAVAGATLTINGYNFGASQVNSSQVYVSSELEPTCFGRYAQISGWSDTQVQFVVPAVPSNCGSQEAVTVSRFDGSTNFIVTSNSASLSVQTSPIAPIVQWATPEPITFGTLLGPEQLNATASIPGTFTYNPAPGTQLPAGPVVLTATFTPTDTLTYTTATVQVNLTVNKAIPTVTWQQPAPITYGTPLSSVQLNATASVPGQFIYNPPAGSLPVKGTDVLYTTFVPSDALDYQSVTATVNLVVNPGIAGIEIPPTGMVSTFLGNGTKGSIGDGGLATDAEVNGLYGMAVDSSGNVYIADTNNNVIREVNAATGIITVVAGNYTAGYSGDGSLAVNAQLNNPYGVAVDAAGNLYVADTLNNVIRVVNATTGNITTVVGDGTGKAGYSGDGGPANNAKMSFPTSVAVDSQGNLYIADWANNSVRAVNVSSGTITTVIGDGTGTAGYVGDGGPATGAQLNQPFGVAVDNSGNIYISDSYNNRIRKVTAATQTIDTFAGNGTQGYLADNGPATSAELYYPLGIALDASGNLFIADWMNNAVREVDTSGIITTVVGTGVAGYSGDGGLGTSATLNGPTAVATDALTALRTGSGSGAGGNLFLADAGNNVGRIAPPPQRNTPPFPVPGGQYLAWAYPTSIGSFSGDASPATTSGSFYGPGSITWTGFSMPPGIPQNATIKGIQAVVAYTATSMNQLTANLSVDGLTFKTISSNGTGVAYSTPLPGTSLPNSITVTLSGQGQGSFNVTAVAVAITFTIPVGGGSCSNYAPYTYTSLTLVDPYLIPNYLLISPMDVVNYLGQTAQGIVADGTATAIAVLTIKPGRCPTIPYDVTLEADNGATLSPWDPAFLTKAPGPQSTSDPGVTLKIPWEQFVYDGTNYYALALVTAGTPATSMTLANTFVSAPNTGLEAQPIMTYPVPIILVHGIWGNKDSLADMKTYFSPDEDSSWIIEPICYSRYLPFDATSDTLSNSESDPCEQTSAQAIDHAVTQIYDELEVKAIVGSRIDVIAHSMGGLAVRNYFATGSKRNPYSYGNTRTRFQGVFRDIVTVDTPEAGSSLADYLDNVLAPKKESSTWVTPYPLPQSPLDRLWTTLCGTDRENTTVRDCMANMGPGGMVHMPLAYPGTDLSTGGVASLIPGNSHIVNNNLPNPNIPGSTWFAIGADAHSTRSSEAEPSLLEGFLNLFVSATYDQGETPVTINSMLGTPHNDIIVPVCSQIYGAIPGQFVIYPGLQHAHLVSSFSNLVFQASGVFGVNDNSVTDWSEVESQIGYWLGYPYESTSDAGIPSPDCTSTSDLSVSSSQLIGTNTVLPSLGALPQLANRSAEETRPSVNSRISLQPMERTVRLAEPFSVTLRLTDPVRSITVFQSKNGQTVENKDRISGIQVGTGSAHVTLDEGSMKTIEIIPLQLGTVDISFQVMFADGKIGKESFSINVVPGSTGLRKFYINDGFHALPIILGKNNTPAKAWVSPEIYYDGLKHSIHLTDAKELELRVEQDESWPVVKVESNGLVLGLRPGTARITGKFGGAEDAVIVHVYPNQDGR